MTKRRIIRKLNLMLGGTALIFGFATLGITVKLIIPIIIVNLMLVFVCCQNRKNGALKTPLIIIRSIAILMTALVFVSPVIGVKFSENKSVYPAKRAVFGYGVRFGENMDSFLPKKIPANCEKYYFRTQLCAIAQNYHPNAYLAFQCDERYFQEYIDFAENHGFKKLTYNAHFEEYLEERDYYKESFFDSWSIDERVFVISHYLNIPSHVFSYLKTEHRELLTPEADVYLNGGCGCVFDKTTGLMIFWS